MARAVVMGVAGSGKSSVGCELSRRIGATYIDGDDLHPAANIAKMSKGHPLTDEDRTPWLQSVGAALGTATGPVIVGCSALKWAYRDRIRRTAGGAVVFIHLTGSRAVIADRMARREGHFMPASLLDSQFAALEPLAGDEAGFALDIDQPLAEIVDAATGQLKGLPEWD